MAKQTVRFKPLKFHYPGFNEVRKAPDLVADLKRRGDAIADAARGGGDGVYHVNVQERKQRVRVTVALGDFEAMVAEQKDRRLTRSLDAGRS